MACGTVCGIFYSCSAALATSIKNVLKLTRYVCRLCSVSVTASCLITAYHLFSQIFQPTFTSEWSYSALQMEDNFMCLY
jgi:hypothetical protein